MMQDHVIYEYPFNDLAKFCLRLEQVKRHLTDLISHDIPHADKLYMQNLMSLCKLLQRNDIKSKLINQFTLLQRADIQIPNSRLGLNQVQIKAHIERLTERLTCQDNAMGQHLFNDSLLRVLWVQINNPGSPCSVTVPEYAYWLALEKAKKQQQMYQWIEPLQPLFDSVDLLLYVQRARQLMSKQSFNQNGYYQAQLDGLTIMQLLRVALPKQSIYYPSISIGLHQANIQCVPINASERLQAFDPEFYLSLCD